MRYKQKCTVGLLESSQLIARGHLGLQGQGAHPRDVGAKIWKKPGILTTSLICQYKAQITYHPHPNFSYVTNKFLSYVSQCHLIFLFYVYLTKFNPNL